ncbi:hypothetical protein [Sporolactobacillus terrae]|uniref:Competence protein ComG n=3 Tax=Sporolactobacillus terrae TaxID=269673 RepID=A0ABX5Q853_9BACL|nr:hypothetical protein [Sporolactobacillus terrae]QAA22793.1 hypothetical protein C0674_09225 [Sporolactobacillus terrae]QAA25766.1 hypothetical protein C0679_09205 [Sporolactobacillus terrae]UAK17643.1 hypothetical protein K7399_06900 [Sporolactobacillus terrae]
MMALSILSILLIVSMPILAHVYDERQIIKQKHEAIRMLQHQLLLWRRNDNASLNAEQDTDFQFEWIERKEHSAYLSVHWTYRGRTYRLTGEALR